MKQDLFIIPHQWLGLPVFGFGWLLILWAIGAAVLLAWLWRRQGWNADTMGYLPVLLIMAAVIAFVLPQLEQRSPSGQPLGLPIRGYGVMLLLAVLAGVSLGAREARRMGLDPDLIYSLALWAFVGGILGARIFYVVQYWDQFQREETAATIRAILNVTEGGLVVYGSLLGGFAAGFAFLRARGLPLLAMADLVTPSLLLGMAIGRIGCLLNGCCYGGSCESPWLGVEFPPGSPVYHHQRSSGELHGFRIVEDSGSHRARVIQVFPGGAAEAAGLEPGAEIQSVDGELVGDFEETAARLSQAAPRLLLGTDRGQFAIALAAYPSRARPVHPTQIYSSINAALLCLLLWAWYPFRRRDGEVFAIALLLYPATRFLLEAVRVDETGRFGTGLTISQIVSVCLILAAMGLWAFLLRRPRGSVLPAEGESFGRAAASPPREQRSHNS